MAEPKNVYSVGLVVVINLIIITGSLLVRVHKVGHQEKEHGHAHRQQQEHRQLLVQVLLLLGYLLGLAALGTLRTLRFHLCK